MGIQGDEAFGEFVRDCWTSLRRSAFLLCGDWHMAEDLAQDTLVKVYGRWRTVRRSGSAVAFARTTLVRTWIDRQRKRSSSEYVASALPDGPAPAEGSPEWRLLLSQELGRLPDMQRAVLVLRFWEDQSVEETARILERNPATVRSDTARGLERLRQALALSAS